MGGNSRNVGLPLESGSGAAAGHMNTKNSFTSKMGASGIS